MGAREDRIPSPLWGTFRSRLCDQQIPQIWPGGPFGQFFPIHRTVHGFGRYRLSAGQDQGRWHMGVDKPGWYYVGTGQLRCMDADGCISAD